MDETGVVTVFLRNGTDVLLLERSDEVGSYPGQWGAVAGHVEAEDGTPREPLAAAREEIREETGLDRGQVTLVEAGEPFPVDDPDHGRWLVHPFLFDCATRDVDTNWETAGHEWVPPTEILRRETVPELWTSYERVGPTVETVADDTEHGSAYISLRALEVLRDRAAALATGRESVEDEWTALADLARDLIDARTSMQVVTNRVNGVMHEAKNLPGTGDVRGGEERSGEERSGEERTGDDRRVGPRTAAAVEAAASRAIEAAVGADAAAAANAADRIADTGDPRVLTLSRSGTVMDAVRRVAPVEVLVAESRPAREGIAVAEALAGKLTETAVTVFVDAGVAHVLSTRNVDAVLVGADAVVSDGSVLNKVGTRAAALAATREGVPTYVVAARDKIAPGDEPEFEDGDPDEVYDGDADLSVLAPRFDVTPPDLIAGVVTEDGLLDAEGVGDVAEEMEALGGWPDRSGGHHS